MFSRFQLHAALPFVAGLFLLTGTGRADSLNFLSAPPPGKPIATFDFEGEAPFPCETQTRYAQITGGADSVNGSKALVSKVDEPSQWTVFFEIKPGLMQLHHYYRITFDYKILKPISDDSFPFFHTKPNSPDGRGKTALALEGPVGVPQRKVYEVAPGDEADCNLAIGIRGSGAIAVDNIRIEELPRLNTTMTSATAKDAVWKTRVGVCDHLLRQSFYKSDGEILTTLDRMQALGVGWIRTDFAWRTLFSESKAVDAGALRRANFIVDEANRRGLQLVAVVGAPPRWASSHPEAVSTLQYPAKDLADYEAYIRFMAETFKGRIHVWEIGNETNWYKFWLAPFSDYLIELRTASRVLRATDPENFILNGGLAATGFVGLKGGNIQALYDLLEPENAKTYDALSIHCYPRHPDEMLYLINNITALMREKKVGKRIWVTETGYSVAGKATQENQAEFLSELLLKLSAHPQVDRVFIYNGRSKPKPENDFERGLGILDFDFTPRKAYGRLQQLFAGPVPDKNSALAGASTASEP